MRDKQLVRLLVIPLIILFAMSLILPFFSTSWSYDAELESSENEFITTAISADGQYVIAGTYDGYVYFFHTSSPDPLWSFDAGEMVRNLAISDDGEYAVVGRRRNTFYVFNTQSPTPLWSYSQPPIGLTIQDLSISADGQYLAVSYDRLYFFSISSSIPLWNTSIYGKVDVSSNGGYIAVGGANGNIYLFNKTTPIPIWVFDTMGDIASIAMSRTGDYIVAGGGQEGNLLFFNKSNSTPLWSFDVFQDVTAVDISDNGNYIVAGSQNDYLYLFYYSSSTPLWQYLTSGDIYSVGISSDGTYICAWNYPHEVFLFHKSYSSPSWSYYNPDISSIYDPFPKTISISSSGQYITFICNKLFLIDRLSPNVDINLLTLILENALGFGIPIGISISLLLIIRNIIDKNIIKIRQEKKDSEIYDVLDKRFQSWEEDDRRKKK